MLLLVAASACQPSTPTVVYVVVSPTPGEAAPPSTATLPPTVPPQPTTPTPTVPPSPTATLNPFPTETVAQVQVAEQVFEHGRMFWVQPAAQIWVMVVDEEGSGRWLRYQDTFVEGEDMSTDPALAPPDGLLQPERGFGKLWRENAEVRDTLGWAITPEFGYISEYRYKPGGTVENGAHIAGPGQHMLLSLNSEAFCFIEATSRWQLGCD